MQTLTVGSDQRKIAYEQVAGKHNGFFWLGGFMSDMTGSKAMAIEALAKTTGHGNTRFDYSGHGQSGGAFTDGTISRWLEEAEAVLGLTSGRQVLIGSSMGGWIAQLLALKHPDRVAAMVLIAPATDMTQDLMWDAYGEEAQRQIMEAGVYYEPSDYGAPYPITRGLIENGKQHVLFGKAIEISCPVHILQGRKDADVPWRHALRLVEAMPHAQVSFTLIPEGDHRLSTSDNLELLCSVVAGFKNQP